MYARSKKGTRAKCGVNGNRGKRFSVIGALKNEKLIAPFIIEGGCNTTIFIEWVEKVLLPSVEKGDTIILDNASIHKNYKIKELIENNGNSILFLSPYSPDLNPIENTWSVMKSRVKKIRTFQNISLESAVNIALPT